MAFCSEQPKKAAIAITQESISLLKRLFIHVPPNRHANEGAHKAEQCASWLVKVCDESLDHSDAIPRHDHQLGFKRQVLLTFQAHVQDGRQCVAIGPVPVPQLAAPTRRKRLRRGCQAIRRKPSNEATTKTSFPSCAASLFLWQFAPVAGPWTEGLVGSTGIAQRACHGTSLPLLKVV